MTFKKLHSLTAGTSSMKMELSREGALQTEGQTKDRALLKAGWSQAAPKCFHECQDIVLALHLKTVLLIYVMFNNN